MTIGLDQGSKSSEAIPCALILSAAKLRGLGDQEGLGRAGRVLDQGPQEECSLEQMTEETFPGEGIGSYM
jgi:hypothetical protein